MKRLGNLVEVLRYQGLGWAWYRTSYAIRNRLGWYQYRLPVSPWSAKTNAANLSQRQVLLGDVIPEDACAESAVKEAESVLAGMHTWFSCHHQHAGFPPDWFASPWNDGDWASDRKHWSRVADHGEFDIKTVWELSRFGWVFPLVRAFTHTQDTRYAVAFWEACEDWRNHNPPQLGPHWKCGQEVAFRMIAWVVGYQAFHPRNESHDHRQAMLAEMIEESAARIEGNIEYALSQKNNHGVSEATGLLTAGLMLGNSRRTELGRRLLNRLAKELIYEDGSFAQHSTNYHRLVLDLYLWCIRISHVFGCPLPDDTIQRVKNAGWWLRKLLVDQSGRTPNLGGNDGARLFCLSDADYLDFRPTVQAVGLMTDGRHWLPNGPWDEMAHRLGADIPSEASKQAKPETSAEEVELTEFPDGGYYVWRDRHTVAMLRAPERLRHRPAQCDLLHFDLWYKGDNILRDAGTYSYNCEPPWMDYFKSARAHNTIEFDGRDPMPKLTRFLYGRWPKGRVAREHDAVITASSRTYFGARHTRRISPTSDGFSVNDSIDGNYQSGFLRWRLDPGRHWILSGGRCECDDVAIDLSTATDTKITSIRIQEGWESLYYMQRSPLPVLEVTFTGSCRSLVSEIRLS